MVKLNTNLNKKSNLLDYLDVGMFMLVISILGFVVFISLDGFQENLNNNFDNSSGENYSQIVKTSNSNLATYIDWTILTFVIVAFIFSVIAAQRIEANSLKIGLMIAASVVFFYISFVISNVFAAFTGNDSFLSYVNLYLPITKILLTYFPFVTGIYLAAVWLSFYNKD